MRSDQYGTMMRCAVPQTGSSGKPAAGAKTLMTMSDAFPGAVVMTAERSMAARRPMSGSRSGDVGLLPEDRHIAERRHIGLARPSTQRTLQLVPLANGLIGHDGPLNSDQTFRKPGPPVSAVAQRKRQGVYSPKPVAVARHECDVGGRHRGMPGARVLAQGGEEPQIEPLARHRRERGDDLGFQEIADLLHGPRFWRSGQCQDEGGVAMERMRGKGDHLMEFGSQIPTSPAACKRQP